MENQQEFKKQYEENKNMFSQYVNKYHGNNPCGSYDKNCKQREIQTFAFFVGVAGMELYKGTYEEPDSGISIFSLNDEYGKNMYIKYYDEGDKKCGEIYSEHENKHIKLCTNSIDKYECNLE